MANDDSAGHSDAIQGVVARIGRLADNTVTYLMLEGDQVPRVVSSYADAFFRFPLSTERLADLALTRPGDRVELVPNELRPAVGFRNLTLESYRSPDS